MVLNDGWENIKTDLGTVLVIQNKNWEVMENEQKAENTYAKSESPVNEWKQSPQLCTHCEFESVAFCTWRQSNFIIFCSMS